MLGWFFFGLASVLILKLIVYLYMRREDRCWNKLLGDYFFGEPAGAVVTLSTVIVGWMIAAIYLEQIVEIADWAGAQFVSGLPKHPSVAALLGMAVEMAAPIIKQLFVKKLSS